MKKRTIISLCLSIFSLFLFSCGIAESNDGSATFTLDTAKLMQMSLKGPNFEKSDDDYSDDFDQFAPYVNFELNAIVHYEIDGKSKDHVESLWTLSGEEASDLVKKMDSMSEEESEDFFFEEVGSKKITIDNLPVGKVARFRMKIQQKISLNIDALTEAAKNNGISEEYLNELKLGWEEWSTDEYIAISKSAVAARIGRDSEITIKLTEYDKSLDWNVPPVSWTLTGTFPSEWSSDLQFSYGQILIYKKTGETWDCVDSVYMYDKSGFTVTGNTGTGSGSTTKLSQGDTVVLTMSMRYQNSSGSYNFVGWSKERTCTNGTNVFDMGEVTCKTGYFGEPAPETMFEVQAYSDSSKITEKYGTIEVFKTDDDSAPIFTKDIEFSISHDSKSYKAKATFSGIDELESLEDGTQLAATLILYEDEARTNLVNEFTTNSPINFSKKCKNSIYFNYYAYESETTCSAKVVTESATTANELKGKYGTIKVFKTDASEPIYTQDICISELVNPSGSKEYRATFEFSDMSAFESIENKTELKATLTLYEDEEKKTQINEVQGWLKDSYFLKNHSNVFSFHIYDSNTNYEGETETKCSAKVSTGEEDIDTANALEGKYGTIKVFRTDTVEQIYSQNIYIESLDKPEDSKNYQTTFEFTDMSAFESIESGTELTATLILYEDEARTTQITEVQGNLKSDDGLFHQKYSNVFSFKVYDLSTSSSSEQQSLTLNLINSAGEAISADGTTYYCALLITESEATGFNTDSMLLNAVVQTSSGTVKITDERIDSIISKDNFYISIALFEDENFAWNLFTTGNCDMAEYSTMNTLVTIDTADNLTFDITLRN